MNFQPIRDVVLVKKEEITQSKGGIFIPTTVVDKGSNEGVVLAVGDGIITESGTILSLKVKVGDKVMFGKSGCIEVKIDSQDYLLMRENNILGILA